MSFSDWFGIQRSENFVTFRGAKVKGSVPLPAEVINEFLQIAAARSGGKVEQMFLTITGDGLLMLSIQVPPLPMIQLRFEIEQGEADFPDSPIWRLRLIAEGFFARFQVKALEMIASLSSRFLPKGLKIEGGTVEFDLQQLGTHFRITEIVGLIRSLAIQVKGDGLLIYFDLQID